MTSANRVQIAAVAETTLGTTPTTPRMRKTRWTREGLVYRPDFVLPEEVRDDRMNTAPVKVGESNSGPLDFEMHFPVDGGVLSTAIESAFFSPWTNSPFRDNDGTADSVITDVNPTGGVVTVTTGAAFVAGQLVRFAGFTNAANNGLFSCTTGSATVPAFNSQGLVTEAAPPAAARMKVVGFQGASGDVTATATGLGSTALNFTTLGLAVGQWVKIGGTGAAFRFATEALNGWARITAIAATALTLDNRPSGWTTDSGAGKTIRVFFGDRIKNGSTKKGLSLERGFLGQTTPTYIVQRGMVADQLSVSVAAKQKITGGVSFLGMTGAQSTTPLDASPDAPPDDALYPIMAASVNVGRIAEAGAALAAPNFVRSVGLTMRNNCRVIETADSPAPVDVVEGSLEVEVAAETYFGDNALLTKLFAGTLTSLNFRVAKLAQALVWGLPALTATEGNPNARGKNTDVMLPLRFSASIDSVTNSQIMLDRFEYFEA